MIALTPEPEALLPEPFDPATVYTRSDEDLDALPFGVVCLTREGNIVRYNLAEARLARLDRTQVLGKSFFRVIAPCTATPEFEGRVRAFLEPGNVEPATRFSYVFDFKFGAQQVEVELVRPPDPDQVWLCINRRKFFAPRTGPEARQPAPIQGELAPGEKTQGVARDDAQRRRVVVSPLFFESMRQTWVRIAPRAWPVFCGAWGLKWGRLAVVDLETEAIEATGKSLRELPMKSVVEQVSAYLLRQGWGRLSADFAPAKKGAFVLVLERSALAEAVGRADTPVCNLFAGFLRAVFCHLANRLLTVQEARCCAQGHGSCAFVVAALARTTELEAAVAQGGADVATVLRLFADAPRPEAS